MPAPRFERRECPAHPTDGTRWFDTEAMLWCRFAAGRGWEPIADLNHSRIPWANAELQVLHDYFETEGPDGCIARLNGRIRYGVQQRARKLGLKDPNDIRGRYTNLAGADLEAAVLLREAGWSFAKIGERFGTCETAATNAILIALCPRMGHRPAERDANGRLLPAEIERLRLMLRKGLKGHEVQLRMAVSAACVAEQRRRYARHLKDNGKAPLPPPGGGLRYSGAKIDPATKREVERLYLAGHATPKVSKLTGVSQTHSLRTRTKLVRRLKRLGQTLPGCDVNGKRLTYPDTILRVPPGTIADLRSLLLQRVPVKQAAERLGLGGSTAYKERDTLRAELEAVGKALPPPIRGGSKATGARWLPVGRNWIILYRQLSAERGPDNARRFIVEGIAPIGILPGAIRRYAATRPLSFEDQLARVRAGAGIHARFIPQTAQAERTFGGVASAQALEAA